MTGQIKTTLLILNTVYAQTQKLSSWSSPATLQSAVCISVSLFISYHIVFWRLSDTRPRHTRKSQCIRQHKL